MSESLRLVIALAYGDTIRQWEEKGLFDRELAYLSAMQRQGAAIDIVSYGSRDEYEFRARLPGMRILCNWLGLSAKRYRRHLHQLHAPRLVKAQVVRTWNSPSLVEASRIAWALGACLWSIARIFLLTDLRRKTYPDDADTIEKLESMESKGLRGRRPDHRALAGAGGQYGAHGAGSPRPRSASFPTLSIPRSSARFQWKSAMI